MAKCFSKSTETREEISTTCNPNGMSRCLSAPNATCLHLTTQEKAANINIMFSVVRIQVFIITVEENVANSCMESKKSPFPRLATGLLVFNAYNC